MIFRFIDTGFNTPAMNMAIDEALLSSPEPVLRVYQWKPAGLSLGYHQDIREINVDFCKKAGISIVRRLTGGNAILHDNEITYSYIIDEKLMPDSLLESYKRISEGLLNSLCILGVDAAMNERVEKKEKSPICFQDPSWYEITVNGKKIIGSAQKRTRGKVLQHGAVLIGLDYEKYGNCFTSFSLERMKERITSITREKGRISPDAVKNALKEGFKQSGVIMKDSALTAEERNKSVKLSEKYASREWNS